MTVKRDVVDGLLRCFSTWPPTAYAFHANDRHCLRCNTEIEIATSFYLGRCHASDRVNHLNCLQPIAQTKDREPVLGIRAVADLFDRKWIEP